jgi:hypothetical protein
MGQLPASVRAREKEGRNTFEVGPAARLNRLVGKHRFGGRAIRKEDQPWPPGSNLVTKAADACREFVVRQLRGGARGPLHQVRQAVTGPTKGVVLLPGL